MEFMFIPSGYRGENQSGQKAPDVGKKRHPAAGGGLYRQRADSGKKLG